MKTPDVIDPTIPQIVRQRNELAATAERYRTEANALMAQKMAAEAKRDELAAALREWMAAGDKMQLAVKTAWQLGNRKVIKMTKAALVGLDK